MKRHPIVSAISAWRAGESYRRRINPLSIHAPKNVEIYLINRVEELFSDGWAAAEKHFKVGAWKKPPKPTAK